MQTYYVSLETAKMLKEINCDLHSGYFYDCDGIFRRNFSDEYDMYPEEYMGNNYYLAYSLYDAQKWLRDKHCLFAGVHCLKGAGYTQCDEFNATIDNAVFSRIKFKTYEQALDAAIKECCEIIKNRKDE